MWWKKSLPILLIAIFPGVISTSVTLFSLQLGIRFVAKQLLNGILMTAIGLNELPHGCIPVHGLTSGCLTFPARLCWEMWGHQSPSQGNLNCVCLWPSSVSPASCSMSPSCCLLHPPAGLGYTLPVIWRQEKIKYKREITRNTSAV